MGPRPRPGIPEYALALAAAAATRSEDPKTQVGAAVLDSRGAVLALGYNGPPSGVEVEDWGHRGNVRLVVVHAEANALRYVRPGEAALLAATRMPCAECLKAAAAQGIREIVYRDRPREDSDWAPAATAALALELGVRLTQMKEDADGRRAGGPWPG